MYEYVNDKSRHGKIDRNWVFFEKGKEYDEVQRNYAISRGAVESDFILKSVKKEPEVIVKKVEPKIDIKPKIELKKIESKKNLKE